MMNGLTPVGAARSCRTQSGRRRWRFSAWGTVNRVIASFPGRASPRGWFGGTHRTTRADRAARVAVGGSSEEQHKRKLRNPRARSPRQLALAVRISACEWSRPPRRQSTQHTRALATPSIGSPNAPRRRRATGWAAPSHRVQFAGPSVAANGGERHGRGPSHDDGIAMCTSAAVARPSTRVLERAPECSPPACRDIRDRGAGPPPGLPSGPSAANLPGCRARS